jgi:hypothetical protein
MTGVIKMGKRIECNKLIQNSHNKIKTTCGVVSKDCGRNKEVKYKL